LPPLSGPSKLGRSTNTQTIPPYIAAKIKTLIFNRLTKERPNRKNKIDRISIAMLLLR